MSSGRRAKAGRLRTIGARLTLLGMGTTLSVCVVVCAVLYAGLAYSLRREIDGFLGGEVLEFISILNEESGESLRQIEAEIRRELGSRLRADLTFRLVAESGELVMTSATNDSIPPGKWRGTTSDGPVDRSSFSTVALAGSGRTVRMCSELTQFGGKPYEAQVLYSLDGMEHSLRMFRGICAGAIALAAILSLLGGRWLSVRLLRPVGAMTESARSITAAKMSDRLRRTNSDDELDRLAATLNEMLDRLEKQFRQMQQFTADASHELRTPLAALRGAAELALSRERSAEELRHTLHESMERYDQLSRIAEELLLLARLDAGDAVLRAEPVRLDTVIDDVVDLYHPYAAERKVEIVFDGRREIWVQADGGRLRQVFGNLIDNSIKYMGRPGRVHIGAELVNGCAAVKIRDDGRGIAATELPRIFDRFYRGDRARSGDARRGAGLGLPICRSLIEAHGGSVTIESVVDSGTEVLIRIPTEAATAQPTSI